MRIQLIFLSLLFLFGCWTSESVGSKGASQYRIESERQGIWALSDFDALVGVEVRGWGLAVSKDVELAVFPYGAHQVSLIRNGMLQGRWVLPDSLGWLGRMAFVGDTLLVSDVLDRCIFRYAGRNLGAVGFDRPEAFDALLSRRISEGVSRHFFSDFYLNQDALGLAPYRFPYKSRLTYDLASGTVVQLGDRCLMTFDANGVIVDSLSGFLPQYPWYSYRFLNRLQGKDVLLYSEETNALEVFRLGADTILQRWTVSYPWVKGRSEIAHEPFSGDLFLLATVCDEVAPFQDSVALYRMRVVANDGKPDAFPRYTPKCLSGMVEEVDTFVPAPQEGKGTR